MSCCTKPLLVLYATFDTLQSCGWRATTSLGSSTRPPPRRRTSPRAAAPAAPPPPPPRPPRSPPPRPPPAPLRRQTVAPPANQSTKRRHHHRRRSLRASTLLAAATAQQSSACRGLWSRSWWARWAASARSTCLTAPGSGRRTCGYCSAPAPRCSGCTRTAAWAWPSTCLRPPRQRSSGGSSGGGPSGTGPLVRCRRAGQRAAARAASSARDVVGAMRAAAAVTMVPRAARCLTAMPTGTPQHCPGTTRATASPPRSSGRRASAPAPGRGRSGALRWRRARAAATARCSPCGARA